MACGRWRRPRRQRTTTSRLPSAATARASTGCGPSSSPAPPLSSCCTAPQLLDDLGLRSLDQLPSLPEIKDMEQLEAALSRLAGQPLEIALAESGDEAGEQPGAPLIETDPPTDVTIH